MSPESGPQYPVRPIQPAELLEVKAETMPDEVFEAVNSLIVEELHGQYAKFTVKALIKRMAELGLDEQEVRRRKWHRIGSIYEKAGWEVTYSSPSMDSNDFDPYYCFMSRNDRSW